MKSLTAKLKRRPAARKEAEPDRSREAKTRYEAPKVISFPLDRTKGENALPQVTMMGNAW